MMKQAALNFDLIRELAFNLPATTLAIIVDDLRSQLSQIGQCRSSATSWPRKVNQPPGWKNSPNWLRPRKG